MNSSESEELADVVLLFAGVIGVREGGGVVEREGLVEVLGVGVLLEGGVVIPGVGVGVILGVVFKLEAREEDTAANPCLTTTMMSRIQRRRKNRSQMISN